jgi:hypothetical protein
MPAVVRVVVVGVVVPEVEGVRATGAMVGFWGGGGGGEKGRLVCSTVRSIESN